METFEAGSVVKVVAPEVEANVGVTLTVISSTVFHTSGNVVDPSNSIFPAGLYVVFATKKLVLAEGTN